MQTKLSRSTSQTVRDLQIVAERLTLQAESLEYAAKGSSNSFLADDFQYHADRLYRLVVAVEQIIEAQR